MTFITHKKVTLITLTLIFILSNEPAVANHGFLFCRNQTTNEINWSETDKAVNPKYASILNKEGEYLRLQGDYWIPSGRLAFFVDKPDENPMTIEQAKAFCTELMTFCPPGQRYTGARLTTWGTKSPITIAYEDPKDHFGKLFCPNWVADNEEGRIYPDTENKLSYSAGIKVPAE